MAIARVKFPRGYDSQNLTMLGKEPLYRDGLEFGHGIGHGVGSYLAVHECESWRGAVSFCSSRISWTRYPSSLPVHPAVILLSTCPSWDDSYWVIVSQANNSRPRVR
jgi:hypothetical protein